jgi:hypothetical protein
LETSRQGQDGSIVTKGRDDIREQTEDSDEEDNDSSTSDFDHESKLK